MGSHRAAKGPSQRQLRVGEELRHVLAAEFARGSLHDPELQNLTITVTEVRISPDLRNATAFVVPLGGSGGDAMMMALRRAAPHLRAVVAHHLQLRHAPQIGFELDHSFDYAKRIDALLHSPEVRRDLAPHHEDDDADPGGDETAG